MCWCSLRSAACRDGYRRLVADWGAERVADALLAKWLTDPDADEKWDRLAARIDAATLRPQVDRRLRERILIWHLANGHCDKAIAAHMGLTVDAVKTYVRAIRRRLGLVGRSRAFLVATVIRHRLDR